MTGVWLTLIGMMMVVGPLYQRANPWPRNFSEIASALRKGFKPQSLGPFDLELSKLGEVPE